jgi:putative endonuclease
MNYNYYVYILSNKYKTVFYTGVTNNLYRRTLEHKLKIHHGFAEKYNTDILVYYELFYNIESAIKREERLKRWKRKWKIDLIEKFNPQWIDLTDKIGDARSEAGMTTPPPPKKKHKAPLPTARNRFHLDLRL